MEVSVVEERYRAVLDVQGRDTNDGGRRPQLGHARDGPSRHVVEVDSRRHRLRSVGLMSIGRLSGVSE
jgi:hypothetical protein